MARYQLNPQAAKTATNIGNRITESGIYDGIVRFAFYEKNENGTESVNIMFKCENQEVGPLSIYTHKGDGTELSGERLVHAIMACMSLRDMETHAVDVDLWDSEKGELVKKRKEVFTAMTDKPLGLVLQAEEFHRRSENGGIGTRLIIVAPFQAQTRLTAAEILTKTNGPKVAKQIESLAAYLEKVPVKKVKEQNNASRGPARNQPPAQQNSRNPGNNPPPAGDDYYSQFDDDIPF